jgi:DNA polymerase
MCDKIVKCKKCGLHEHQMPLLDDIRICQVCWVGLSAKKKTYDDEKPLSHTTNSGSILSSVERRCKGVSMYKTNLVKCLPLDEGGKLRYPNKSEIDLCLPNLSVEINELSPQIIFLLGSKVIDAVSRYYSIKFEKWNEFDYTAIRHKNAYFVPVHHPSFIFVYRRKSVDEYVGGLESVISRLL